MSAEAFTTILSCDVRTAPDEKGREYAQAGSGQPRWVMPDGHINHTDAHPWATCFLYAEDVVRIAAQAIREQPMDGITGDHPDKRAQVATELEEIAAKVRLLALDHAGDAKLGDWA